MAAAHQFGLTLREYAVDVPLVCGENWSRSTIDAAIARGLYMSATSPEEI